MTSGQGVWGCVFDRPSWDGEVELRGVLGGVFMCECRACGIRELGSVSH